MSSASTTSVKRRFYCPHCEKCSVKSDNGDQLNPLWVAAVSWYSPHNCFVWFGKPTQVWNPSPSPGYTFIHLDQIKSRVAFTTASVDFGRIIGLNTVLVVVPLDT